MNKQLIQKFIVFFVLFCVLLLAIFLLWHYVQSFELPSLEKPSGVSAVMQSKDVKVSWNVVTYSTSYRVFRRIPGGDWKLLDVVPSSKQSYVDKNVDRSDYEYSVKACNNGLRGMILSPYSAAVTIS